MTRREGDRRIEVLANENDPEGRIILEVLDTGRALATVRDVVYLALFVMAGADVPPRLKWLADELGANAIVANTTDAHLIDAMHDLRYEIDGLNERLTALEAVTRHEEEIKQLWHELGGIKDRLNGLPGDVMPEAPPVDHEKERQTALSSKLKKMSFAGLMQ